MGKKIVLSDEEFNKLPSENPRRRKKTIVSEKEFKDLPSSGEEVEEDKSIGQSILEGVGTVAEYVDRYTGAPVRAGIGAAQEGKEPFSAAYEQIGEPTEFAPTGKEIAQKAGVSEDVLFEDVPLIGDITKSGLAGFGIEMVADPTAFLGAGLAATGRAAKAIKPVRLALKGRAGRSAFKALAQISTDTKIKEVFNKNRVEIVGQHLLESDLGKYLNKPNIMLERIKGKEITKYTQKKIGRSGKIVDVPSRGRSGGLISDVSKETDDILNKISPNIEKIDINDMAKNLSERNIRLRIDPKSAEKFNAKDMANYEKKINEFLKPIGGKADMRSVVDLQALKKDLGKKLSSKEFFAPTDRKLALEKNAMLDVYHQLKRTIEGAVDGVPVSMGDDIVDAGLLVGQNNQKITSLMDVGNLLENIPAKELRSQSTVQRVVDLLTSAAVGTGTAAATGSTTAGIVAGGAYGASKLGKTIAEGIPAVAAQAIDNFMKAGVSKKMLTPAIVRPFRDENVGREPQSLPEELTRTPLPRSSEEIMANKDFVLAKVAQQAPDMFDHVQEVIENNPETLPDIMPALAMAAPNLFTRDKYNRIDGIIIDPQMKNKARQDTMDNDDLSYLDKTMIINKLNKTGAFDDN